jgi:hypothetical protein
MGILKPDELTPKELELNKKPIWKNRSFWILGVIILFIIASQAGLFDSKVPKGVDEKFYGNAVEAFHEINYVYETGNKLDSSNNHGVAWLADSITLMEQNPSDFTQEEVAILKGLQLEINALAGLGTVTDDNALKNLEGNLLKIRQVVAEKLNVKKDSQNK